MTEFAAQASAISSFVKIQLMPDIFTLIDREDMEIVIGRAIIAVAKRDECYAGIRVGNRTVPLHRFLMSPPETMVVDHVNGDTLDNRRANLRVCTHQQNMWNSAKQSNSSLKYKGVRRTRNSSTFHASIACEGKQMYIGSYATQEDAALAYNAAAIKFHGKFARLNFVEGQEP